jgi:UDP-glucose 4-epimerase
MYSVLQLKKIQVYGDSFPTHDGTCIRDFINVEDVVRAHILAKDFLNSGKCSEPLILNIGSGLGYSVLQVVNLFKKYCEKNIEIEMCKERNGDPISAVASPLLATHKINFRAIKTIEQSVLETLSNY